MRRRVAELQAQQLEELRVLGEEIGVALPNATAQPADAARAEAQAFYRNRLRLGPSLVFAGELVKLGGAARVGLVASSGQGMCMSSWQPGQVAFEHLLRRALVAVQKSPGSRLAGLVLYAGECDAAYSPLVQRYAQAAATFLDALREEFKLSIPGQKEFRVLQVALPVHSQVPHRVRFNAIQMALPQQLPYVTSVDAYGVQLKDDRVHYSREGSVELGRRLARAFVSPGSQHPCVCVAAAGCPAECARQPL